jgi:hypothetical protein
MHEIPSSLEEMQHWFAHWITAPIAQSEADQIPLFPLDAIPGIRQKIAPSPTLRSEERLGIYQQQYWWRLISVMQDLFPSLVALLDYEEFNRLIAEPYLASHIPQDWFISNIGADLPKWLTQQRLPYSELAILDLAYEQLLFADILPSIDLSKCEEETLYLQPFVLLFELDADLFSYRKQLLQEKKESSRKLKKWRKRKYFVLYRLHETNDYEEIQPVFFELLSQLQTGAQLSELIPLLEKCEDVTAVFQTMASRGWLTFSSPKASNRSMQILAQTQKRSKRQKES